MKRKLAYAAVLCVSLVAIMAMMVAPVGAIIGGTQDTGNTHNNAGMILFQTDGVWDLDGSCTLVKNDADEVIVLTAAHCLDWVTDPRENLMVTFDQLPLPDMAFTSYEVVRAEVHPDYLLSVETTPYIGNSKRFGIGPGREDVALLWLDRVVPDVDPAPIVSEGGLDALHLKREAFTVVGYGINSFVAGSFMSWRNPNTTVIWSGRNYKEVSVVSTHDAFGDRYLKVTESTAFGDSGGPTFYDDPEGGDTVVGVTVWGGSMRCQGPAHQYRLDTESAWEFLGDYLELEE